MNVKLYTKNYKSYRVLVSYASCSCYKSYDLCLYGNSSAIGWHKLSQHKIN